MCTNKRRVDALRRVRRLPTQVTRSVRADIPTETVGTRKERVGIELSTLSSH